VKVRNYKRKRHTKIYNKGGIYIEINNNNNVLDVNSLKYSAPAPAPTPAPAQPAPQPAPAFRTPTPAPVPQPAPAQPQRRDEPRRDERRRDEPRRDERRDEPRRDERRERRDEPRRDERERRDERRERRDERRERRERPNYLPINQRNIERELFRAKERDFRRERGFKDHHHHHNKFENEIERRFKGFLLFNKKHHMEGNFNRMDSLIMFKNGLLGDIASLRSKLLLTASKSFQNSSFVQSLQNSTDTNTTRTLIEEQKKKKCTNYD